MSLKLEFERLWAWFKKTFASIEGNVDTVAISVTQHLKQALDSGAAGFITHLIDSLTNTGIASEVVGIVKLNLPKILSVELAIKGLPPNPTEQDILDFENRCLDAFGIHNQKSKLYTVMSAQLYGIIQTLLNKAEGTTFADWVAAVEEAYQDYHADLADEGNG